MVSENTTLLVVASLLLFASCVVVYYWSRGVPARGRAARWSLLLLLWSALYWALATAHFRSARSGGVEANAVDVFLESYVLDPLGIMAAVTTLAGLLAFAAYFSHARSERPTESAPAEPLNDSKALNTKPAGGVTVGFLWLLLGSVLLFWLPLVGPLIAGLVGGLKAGSLGNAVAAVLLPWLLLGGIVLVFGLAGGVTLSGGAVFLLHLTLTVTFLGPLLAGAVLGGLIAQ